MHILIIVGACVVSIAVVSTALFRLLLDKAGTRRLVEEGIVLTEAGIEFPRFFFLRGKASYEQIAAVEVVPFPKNIFLRLRYGPSVSSTPGARWDGMFSPTLVITFKTGQRSIQHRLFSPSNPSGLAAQLRSRISQEGVGQEGVVHTH